VLDAWLAYAAVEPEAFGFARDSEEASNPRLMDAREAVRRMSQRL
jgi:hypothetical protein